MQRTVSVLLIAGLDVFFLRVLQPHTSSVLVRPVDAGLANPSVSEALRLGGLQEVQHYWQSGQAGFNQQATCFLSTYIHSSEGGPTQEM